MSFRHKFLIERQHIAVILRVVVVLVEGLIPESGVKNAISNLNRLQSVNLAQDAVGQILEQWRLSEAK
ncbi:MAG: hypothetical protein ABSH49_32325, partial [Bryobacteraceae bacterium]